MQTILEIEDVHHLTGVPSGSGIALYKDTLYIVGDDATSIFMLRLQDYSTTKFPVNTLNALIQREEKPVKHDFETASVLKWQGEDYLASFGSGSLPVYRDSLLLVNLRDHTIQSLFSLSNFYKQLQQRSSTDSTAWNIEAAVNLEDTLLLFNRGNNMLASFNSNELLQFLTMPGQPFPACTFKKFQLPVYEQKEARISGACAVSNDLLAITASVEDAPDWYHDGPIMGSYIGIYSVKENKVISSHLLTDQRNNVIREKLESIELLRKEEDGSLHMVAIADNDDGSSKIYKLLWKIIK